MACRVDECVVGHSLILHKAGLDFCRYGVFLCQFCKSSMQVKTLHEERDGENSSLITEVVTVSVLV